MFSSDSKQPKTLFPIARPFVKWAGGKRSILPELMGRLPKSYLRYIEPFVGGGALFFASMPHRAYLSDINPYLIAAYRAIRDDVEALIDKLKFHERQHSREYYMDVRRRLHTTEYPLDQAALFIYLNKTCFNGLYRVNHSGVFNTSFGNYPNPKITDEGNLRNVSMALQGVEIHRHLFWRLSPQAGEFYYLDPPYHQAFDSYHPLGFGIGDHILLADFCRSIHRKGGLFMLSNSNTSLIRALYKDFNIEEIHALRSISGNGNQRGRERELIIRNYC